MRKGLIGITMAFAFTAHAYAGDANPVDMAHQVGFTGCDNLITDTFEFALKANNRRVGTKFFDESKKTNLTIIASFGDPGDIVTTTASFHKSAGKCIVQREDILAEKGVCSDMLMRDKYFKFKDEIGGVVIAENAGGVEKRLMQVEDVCLQAYYRGNSMPLQH
ncbi:uncharacterized protein NMK_1816 [Novimethylophilus kurashikiensis]|uniref:Uncharacterized protein n=1 Tax=Novimethylophilus kurashikiensis TaxID=1825523 RepID=A0A2R5FC25_9PROT|nr:hypothetical protein [Novimethylophilus kurashikiensis]GBG14251.1 uncharacterized protein NMK_1816 [Novimethylophilus kurashikiensis]